LVASIQAVAMCRMRMLPAAKRYGEYGLVNLIGRIPSLNRLGHKLPVKVSLLREL
jgi:hypothetical protein